MKLLLLLIALAVLGSFPCRAEDLKTPDAVMTFAVKKMANYKTWSAQFSHLLSNHGLPTESAGMFICKPPQLRAQIASDSLGVVSKTLMAIGKDHILWLQTETKDGGKILRGDLQKLSYDDINDQVPQAIFLDVVAPAKLWETSKKDFTFTLGTNEMLDGTEVYSVLGTLKPQTASELLRPDMTNEIAAVTGLCRFLVGLQDGFVYLVERSVNYTHLEKRDFLDAQGEGLLLKKVTFNQETPDEKFVYKPRKGVPITDLKPVTPAGATGDSKK